MSYSYTFFIALVIIGANPTLQTSDPRRGLEGGESLDDLAEIGFGVMFESLLAEPVLQGGVTTGTREVQHQRYSVRKWSSFPIKFSIDASYSEKERVSIRQGLAMWQNSTCISFKESSLAEVENGPGLIFHKGIGCRSFIGQQFQNAPQQVSLGIGCTGSGTVAHEVGHALGLLHEHERPDRDSFVKINGKNWTRDANEFTDDTPYDHGSIMHYERFAFGSNFRDLVVEPHDVHFLATIGQSNMLSFLDAKRINMRYKCVDKVCASIKLAQVCQHGGYQDPKNCNRCRCPLGYGGDFCTTHAPSSGREQCGGVFEVASCSTTVLLSPGYPHNYPPRSSCSWLIRAPVGSGLVFTFEGPLKLPCSSAYSCVDFVEIRTNKTDPTLTGKRFCKCAPTSGRPVAFDYNHAVVHFQSFSSSGSAGFLLNVYATCNNTLATKLTKECIISSNGYDYVGTRSEADGGAKCLHWANTTSFDKIAFPSADITAAGQSCRNLDGSTKPWCLTDSGIRSCSNISQCPNHVASELGKTRQAKHHTVKIVAERPADCRATIQGRAYVGTVNVTRRGLQCQRWDFQWPHEHPFVKDSQFPDKTVREAQNYCRNPDPAVGEGVWCYTTDPKTHRDFCDVPLCLMSAENVNQLIKSQSSNSSPSVHQVIICSPFSSVISVLLILILLIVDLT